VGKLRQHYGTLSAADPENPATTSFARGSEMV